MVKWFWSPVTEMVKWFWCPVTEMVKWFWVENNLITYPIDQMDDLPRGRHMSSQIQSKSDIKITYNGQPDRIPTDMSKTRISCPIQQSPSSDQSPTRTTKGTIPQSTIYHTPRIWMEIEEIRSSKQIKWF